MTIHGILPSEQVELTVKPVFTDTVFFHGEPFKIHQRAPGEIMLSHVISFSSYGNIES